MADPRFPISNCLPVMVCNRKSGIWNRRALSGIPMRPDAGPMPGRSGWAPGGGLARMTPGRSGRSMATRGPRGVAG